MQDLKTGLYLAEKNETQRVLPQTSADIVEINSASGAASNVQAEIVDLRNSKLEKPAVGGEAGQILGLDESGNTVWKADEKGDTLPSVASATAGQVLKVNSAANGTEWGDLPETPKELPEQIGTAGQVLAVNSAADGVEWKTPETGLPAIDSSAAGDLLAVNSTADGVEFVKPAFYSERKQISISASYWEPAATTANSSKASNFYSTKTLSEIFGISGSELLALANKIVSVNISIADGNQETLVAAIAGISAVLNLLNQQIIFTLQTVDTSIPTTGALFFNLDFLVKN